VQGDSEVIYELCRFLHILGTASPAAHAAVMQCRDHWKNLSVKLANAKRAPAGTSETAHKLSGPVVPFIM
jgi:hypothetical protein